MSRPNRFFILGLALFTLAMRLMPYALRHLGVSIDPATTIYPWNFSPMAAFCLFSAAYGANKVWSYGLPILIYFLGDLGILALTGRADWVFTKGLVFVYASFLLVIWIGTFLREKRNLPSVLLAGLVGEVVFFLITNFAVWCFATNNTSSPFYYSKDAAGLLHCYTMALPFFGKSLASTMFYSVVIFSPFLYKERKAEAWASESSRATT